MGNESLSDLAKICGESKELPANLITLSRSRTHTQPTTAHTQHTHRHKYKYQGPKTRIDKREDKWRWGSGRKREGRRWKREGRMLRGEEKGGGRDRVRCRESEEGTE